MDDTASGSVNDMTDEEKRRDQLLSAPDAVEADAAARIQVTKHGDVTRIDIAPRAAVRPGLAEDPTDKKETSA